MMKILLVEDNPLDIDLATRDLVRAIPGVQVHVAMGVGEALTALHPSVEFDVVLTDLRLPDGSWRLARETRWISIPWLRAHLDPARGPWVESALVVNLTGRPRP